MYQHHIQTKTYEELSPELVQAWLHTVTVYGPDDITLTYEHNGEQVSMEYGRCDDCEFSHVYTVPLKRDLTYDETLFIVQAWEHVYAGDFDIEISNMYENMDDDAEIEIDEDIRQRAIADLNKQGHNRWVNQQMSEGWRWGTHYNSREKTHPALRGWDELPESHRREREITNKEIFEWMKFHRII